MKIAILGAGRLGTSLARRLRDTHKVALCFSTDKEKLIDTAAKLRVDWASPADAVRDAEVVVLAVPWSAVMTALLQCGPLEGKILWDCTNPINPEMTGLLVGTTSSAGETVARIAQRATVIKAIPPFAELLEFPPMQVGQLRPAVFVCGDSAEGKRTVSTLVSEIGGEAVDAGPLTTARLTEPLAMLLVRLAYSQGLGGRIGAPLVRYR